ncbi:hypothetical protein HanPI659440_Chr03g0095091 [Helianthus annuus]|nr:hypothetical protein HanPI659440_Chr03g0095091 [Helianthus annuus]
MKGELDCFEFLLMMLLCGTPGGGSDGDFGWLFCWVGFHTICDGGLHIICDGGFIQLDLDPV